jgi:hypothetical protein
VGLGNPLNSRGLARDTGRVAAEHVQGASPKSAARLGSAAGVTKARLLGFGKHRMKITLAGRYSVEQFLEAVERALHNLHVNGVEEIQNANLYLSPYADRRMVDLLDEEGQRIEHLTIDGPRERKFHGAGENVRVVRPPRSAPEKPNANSLSAEAKK